MRNKRKSSDSLFVYALHSAFGYQCFSLPSSIARETPLAMLATETDLYGPGQEAFIAAFNRRLTKRIARTCSLSHVLSEQETGAHLSGGLRLNFNFRKPVKVRNEVVISGSLQTFDTDFIFSTKTALIVQVNDKVS
jgi:hypothetical protein